MFWRKERFDMSKTFFQFTGQGRSGRRSSGREGVIIRNSNSKSYTVLGYPKSSRDIFVVATKDLYGLTKNISSAKIIWNQHSLQ